MANEWTRYGGTTNAPGAQAEADVHELGRGVAQELGYQAGAWWDPDDDGAG
jgi:hypothetical protein